MPYIRRRERDVLRILQRGEIGSKEEIKKGRVKPAGPMMTPDAGGMMGIAERSGEPVDRPIKDRYRATFYNNASNYLAPLSLYPG